MVLGHTETEAVGLLRQRPRPASSPGFPPPDSVRHPSAQRKQGDSGTDSFRCVEMREGAPWVWQADTYGAAACAHVLLYGRYMEVERVRDSATGWCPGIRAVDGVRARERPYDRAEGRIVLCSAGIRGDAQHSRSGHDATLCKAVGQMAAGWGLALLLLELPAHVLTLHPLPACLTVGVMSLRLAAPFKRQWAGELWGAFFARLLNHRGGPCWVRGSCTQTGNADRARQQQKGVSEDSLCTRSLILGYASNTADPALPPAVDDLLASFEAHLATREASQRLRRELTAAAALVPTRS